VAFHELTHWTAHKSRLDRDLKNRFGSRNYAGEELIAELGAAFLCAEFGFDGDLRHAGYIGLHGRRKRQAAQIVSSLVRLAACREEGALVSLQKLDPGDDKRKLPDLGRIRRSVRLSDATAANC
jgi:antirestriction protein ArdC